MVIFKDGSYMKDSQFPNTDFTNGEAVHVIPDNTELANKIQSLGVVSPVVDDSGNIIDVVSVNAEADRAEEIKQELLAIDNAAIRPLRAIVTGVATEEDEQRLEELESQAKVLRAELADITATATE